MAKTILVGGFGPGISNAVAERFGREGFSVALVARSQGRLDEGVKRLAEKGIRAEAFAADLGDPEAARAAVRDARAKLGPITVLQWNAAPSRLAGDLLSADVAALRAAYDLAVVGMIVAVQEALPDLRGDKESAVLVTNGGFGLFEPVLDAVAVQWNVMGLALANSSKHKAVRLLSQKLSTEGVYVGEVMVLGVVKGSAADTGQATVDPSAVADKFWGLYRERGEAFAQVR